MTILAPKKSGQAAKSQEQEGVEQTPAHQAQQPPRSPQGGELLGSPGHRWSPGLREEAEGGHEGRKRPHRASPHRRPKRERNAAPTPPVSAPAEAASGGQQEGSQETADPSGYNSGDEHGPEPASLTENEWIEMERNFAKKLGKKGLMIREMDRDGACLFRAVADQVYGDQESHQAVRKNCMDYLERNRDHFSQYMTEDFDLYVGRKRETSCHGNHIELQAVCEMYNRPVQIYCYKTEPINIFHGCMQTDNEPIRLSYERGSHYNSIYDPHKPSIGVGLGLPSFQPGLADKSLMTDALQHSENFEIEEAMLKDKIFASDIEATNIAIEEQVARASYMDWVRESEKRRKSKLSSSTATSTVTSGSCAGRPRSHGGSPGPVEQLRGNSPRNSPKAGPSSSFDLFYNTPSTSSSGLFFGPSTSSYPEGSSPAPARTLSPTGQRPPEVPQNTNGAASQESIFNVLLGVAKGQGGKYNLDRLSHEDVENVMKQLQYRSVRPASSSSPRSQSSSSSDQ